MVLASSVQVEVAFVRPSKRQFRLRNPYAEVAFEMSDTDIAGGELLYNGIRLPKEWPPRTMDPAARKPMPVPYLDYPPVVIPIDVGRQLFVDEFLIETTSLKRVFHAARKYEGNPILVPETEAEQERAAATACPFDDGIAYDPVMKNSCCGI